MVDIENDAVGGRLELNIDVPEVDDMAGIQGDDGRSALTFPSSFNR